MRPRLVEKLLTGLDQAGSFALISSPAGSGKTTLLSEFAAQLTPRVAWLSLDDRENEPGRFWIYFISACRSVLDDVGESALALLQAGEKLPQDTIPSILINDFAAQDRSVVLVLDDYHEIQNPSIHAGVQFLLDHLPPTLYLLISTRIDPPWPMARFRVRNQLIEIRSNDLRFSSLEVAEFLNQVMGLALSAGEVAALEERTEGWIAGLQLAALSMQGRDDLPAFVKAFTGSHVYVADYLVEEVLQRQPEDLRTFMLQTSILKRMNAGLCEAVTSCQDGQEILQSLHQANIFVVPLDNERQWFRYHHLFADLLNARLRQSTSAEVIAALHLCAAGWYEGNGFLVDAIQHALAARDFEKAAVLLDQAGQNLIFTDQYVTLRNWLGMLPEESFRIHPRLEIYCVLIDLSLGKIDMFEETLREKEKLIKSLPPSPENDLLRLEAVVYLCSFYAHQNTSRAIQLAQEALAEIADDELRLHASLYSALYRAYGMAGDIEKSAPAYRECLRLSLAAGQYGMIANTTMVRAFDLCQYGRLDEGATYCQMILDAGARLNRKVYYPAGPAYIGLAGIHLERFDLQPAEEYLRHGLELCRQGAMYGLYTGYIQWSRLLQAKGDLQGSNEELRSMEQMLQRRDFTLTARQVSIRLAMGDIAGASDLIAPTLEVFGDSPYAQVLPLIAAEAFKLCLTRIYIAQGEIEQAHRLLDEIQVTVEPGQRFGRLMEVYLLRSLAMQKQAGGLIPSEAIANLERALELAKPAGFVLLLLEEGPALIPLLEAVVAHRGSSAPAKVYAQKLLDVFNGRSSSAVSQPIRKSVDLFEQLTSREMEVLELIAAGDSNQMIADKLFITARTVKKHAGNIYGKLNVDSRTQAVARGRELGLLSSD